MNDGRRRTDTARAATKRARIARQSQWRRRKVWTRGASAADGAGHPLNVTLTVTWSKLDEADRRPGHCLDLPVKDRDRKLWASLRLVAMRAGVPWLAMRGPEYDRQRGLHLHMVAHLPDVLAIRDAIDVIEKLTGAPAEWVDMRGRSMRGAGRSHGGIVARSAGGGWMLQRRIEALGNTAAPLAVYLAKADGKDRVEGQHRLSHDLSALARSTAPRVRGQDSPKAR